MISAEPESALYRYCRLVSDLKPGQRINFDTVDLKTYISGFWHNGAYFTPADRICENIVGSAYNISYWMHPDGKTVTFAKHEYTGERRYISPDRR